MHRSISRLFLRRVALLLLVAAAGVHSAYAQFYYNGRGPMNLRWKQIKSPTYKLVYPDYYEPTAVAMAGFLDSIAPHITRGFSRSPQRLPILLHTENLYSNGEVVWAPKRMELMTTAPASDIYADPWLKQLTVHESRHVVQLSSLRSGFTRIASWLFGQAGSCVGMLVVPKWFLEGDATLAETQFSEFGRALQPSFTVGLRAILAQDSTNVKIPSDRWSAGSYRTYLPGVYEYGYQMVAAGERYGGEELWGKAVEYAGRWPIFVAPMRIYLKRHHNLRLSDLSRSMLTDLYVHWKPYSSVPNSYTTLTQPTRSGKAFTTYADPLHTPRGIVATKTDYDTPPRFVVVDTTATQRDRTLRWIAPPSSRPVLADDVLWWTEYKPHPIWEYKTYSVVRSLDLKSGKRKAYGRWQANYFATPIRIDSTLWLATVAPDSLGGSDLVLHTTDPFQETDRLRFDPLTTLHGLAWDSTTRSLAFITLGERGMQLCRSSVTADGTLTPVEALTAPSMTTLSALSTDGAGHLYFSSIQSGKDEIHRLDLTDPTHTEERMTTSRFGAYTPSADTANILFTTYTVHGPMVASSPVDSIQDTVLWSRLPRNLLNLPTPSWNVPTMSTTPMDDSTTTHPHKKYYKGLRWFNLHSWAPFTADIEDLLNFDERMLNIGFGASLFFQSAMGDSYGSATYGRLHRDNWLQASWTYAGLPVQFTAAVEYGGGKQSIYAPVDAAAQGIPMPLNRKNYLHAAATLALPLTLSGGSHYRLLQPSFSVVHYNSLLYDPALRQFTNGVQKYQASIWWSDNRRASTRSLTPRLGYALRADLIGTFNRRFGMIYSLYTRAYLPGLLHNHSITLRTGWMYQTQAELGLAQKPLFPRGAYNSQAAKYFAAGAIDYTLPVCYPDWGINGMFYLKRIWMNLFGDYSRGAYFAPENTTLRKEIYSFGGDIGVEMHLAGATTPITFTLTLASPSNAPFYYGVGFSLSF